MSSEEAHIIDALAELARKLSVRCLVQVGAETGYEAYCIQAGIGCRVVCIDGDVRCRPVSDELEYHHAIIGAEDGSVSFYAHPVSGLSSLISNSINGEQCLTLQQWRLDTFCALKGIEPDALITDTEGTTLDVLSGCGEILDRLKLVYAECQTYEVRPGIRPLAEVDALLRAHGMVRRHGLPAYSVGAQGNYTWVRDSLSTIS